MREPDESLKFKPVFDQTLLFQVDKAVGLLAFQGGHVLASRRVATVSGRPLQPSLFETFS